MDGYAADLLGDSPEWQERAGCAHTDPDAFYPGDGGDTRPAKRVCARCEVRAECLAYAQSNDDHWGIWGGLTWWERRKLRALTA